MNNITYFKNNETIIKAGEKESKMYIILEGQVNVILQEGNNQIIVATMSKGDFFGEISMFTNTPRSATVKAIGNVKLVYIDNASNLKLFLLKNPQFSTKMTHILAQRLAKTNEILLGKINEINQIKETNSL